MRPPPPNRGLRDRRSFPTQNPGDRPLESGRTRCGCRGGCREGRDQGVPPPMALEERHQNHRANHTSRLRTPRHKDRPQTPWNAPRSRQPPRGSEWHASETGTAPDPREFEVVRGREGRQDRNAPPPPTWRFQGSRDASRRSRAWKGSSKNVRNCRTQLIRSESSDGDMQTSTSGTRPNGGVSCPSKATMLQKK